MSLRRNSKRNQHIPLRTALEKIIINMLHSHTVHRKWDKDQYTTRLMICYLTVTEIYYMEGSFWQCLSHLISEVCLNSTGIIKDSLKVSTNMK